MTTNSKELYVPEEDIREFNEERITANPWEKIEDLKREKDKVYDHKQYAIIRYLNISACLNKWCALIGSSFEHSILWENRIELVLLEEIQEHIEHFRNYADLN